MSPLTSRHQSKCQNHSLPQIFGLAENEIQQIFLAREIFGLDKNQSQQTEFSKSVNDIHQIFLSLGNIKFSKNRTSE